MESLKKHNSEDADRLSKMHIKNTVINILKNVVVKGEKAKALVIPYGDSTLPNYKE